MGPEESKSIYSARPMSTSTKALIKKYNIRLTKSLGQNFLIDEQVIKRIVHAADIEGDDLVIEVGSGIGNMTRELAAKAGKVAAIEIDRHLLHALSENVEEFENVEIINEDILKFDIKNYIYKNGYTGQESSNKLPIKVIGNLPYYITTPVIMRFLEEISETDLMVLMVQKEVADRMLAKPGTSDYGALSVAVQFYSRPEKIFDVPPHCFIPQPGVYSTVIRLNINKKPPVELINKELFFKTVKASFGQRRKTLLNALYNSGYFAKSKEEIKVILQNIGISERQRGETLSIMQFAQLSNSLSQKDC